MGADRDFLARGRGRTVVPASPSCRRRVRARRRSSRPLDPLEGFGPLAETVRLGGHVGLAGLDQIAIGVDERLRRDVVHQASFPPAAHRRGAAGHGRQRPFTRGDPTFDGSRPRGRLRRWWFDRRHPPVRGQPPRAPGNPSRDRHARCRIIVHALVLRLVVRRGSAETLSGAFLRPPENCGEW